VPNVRVAGTVAIIEGSSLDLHSLDGLAILGLTYSDQSVIHYQLNAKADTYTWHFKGACV